MASPLAISLSSPTELSKTVETLIGSYFDAAACGVTGYRDSMEDAHAMLSFSLNGKQTLTSNSNNVISSVSAPTEGSFNSENPFLSPNGFLAASSALVSSINKNYACFGIFDGHASSECAEYMSKNLPLAIQKTMEEFSTKLSSSTTSSSPSSHQHQQQPLLFESESTRKQLAAQITKTFNTIDKEFLNVVLADDPGNNHCDTFGSTAVVVIIEPLPSSSIVSSPSPDVTSRIGSGTSNITNPGKNHQHHQQNRPLAGRAMICNLGDSRCVIMRDGKEIFSTIDQKPNDPVEKTRIEKAGEEFYVETASSGIHRISGTISVARAFGDKPFKPFQDPDRDPVSSSPVIDFIDLYEDDVILLGCDGLFEGSMSDQSTLLAHLSARMSQAVARLQHKLMNRVSKQQHQQQLGHTGFNGNSTSANFGATTKLSGLPFVTLSTICAELCHRACNGGSKDNISAMLVRLSKDHLLVNNAHGNTRRRSSASNASPQPTSGRRRSQLLAPIPKHLLGAAVSSGENNNNINNNVSRRDNDTEGETVNEGHMPLKPRGSSNALLGASMNQRKRAKSVANHPDARRSSVSVTILGSSHNLKADAQKSQQQQEQSNLNTNNPFLAVPGSDNTNNNNNNNNDNNTIQPHRPLSGKPPGKSHSRSHSTNNHNAGNNINNNKASTSSSTPFGGGGIVCDPLLLINKLQTKFIAGPLPEYDKSWHVFKRMAEDHGADPKLAAKKRLRMLRVANEVMTESAKTSMIRNNNSNNANNNNNNSNSNNNNIKTGSPDLTLSSPTLRNNNQQNQNQDDLSSPLSCTPGGLQSQFSRTMVPPSESSSNNMMMKTDLNFGNVISAASSNDWLQQYASTLIQSGEYTEEDVALLTCEQTSLQLAGEYHRMLAILIQQHMQQTSSSSASSGNSNSTNPPNHSHSHHHHGRDDEQIDSLKLTQNTSDDVWIDHYLNYVSETSMVSQRRANLSSIAQREFDASFGGNASGTNPFKAFVSMAPHHSSVSSSYSSQQHNQQQQNKNTNNNNTDLSWSCTNAQDAVLQLISQQNDDDDDDDDYFDEENLEDDDNGGGYFGSDAGGGDDDDDGDLNMTVRRS